MKNSNFEKNEKDELKQKATNNDEKINELQDKILKLDNQLKNEMKIKENQKIFHYYII